MGRGHTRQDDHVLHVLVLHVREQPGVLAHRVGGALEPLGSPRAGRLRSRQHLGAEQVRALPLYRCS